MKIINIIKKIICIFLVLILISSLLYIVNYYYDVYSSKKQNNLLNQISSDTVLSKSEEVQDIISNKIETNNTQNPKINSANYVANIIQRTGIKSTKFIEQNIPNSTFNNKTERMLKLEELQKQNSDIVRLD